MSNQSSSKNEFDDQDPLWDLIRRNDTHVSSIEPSPWFVTRTVAKALSTPQSRGILPTTSFLRRILLPVPLAGIAALLFFTVHVTQKCSPGSFVSTEAEFEQHMEMLASSDSGI